MDSMKFIFQITTHTNLIFTVILDQIMIHVSITEFGLQYCPEIIRVRV